MARRLELHSELVDLLGSSNVYFQPPETVKLKYPCFIYSIAAMDVKYADDKAYAMRDAYEVLFITRDADNDMRERLLRRFSLSIFDRPYTVDNLYHYLFRVYY